MSNTLFDKGREHFLSGDIDWVADNIKLILVNHSLYVPQPSVDESLNDILNLAIVATSSNFTGKTNTNGVADAHDLYLTSVTGATSDSMIIYKDSGVLTTSWLIAFIDTATGLPFIPNGGNLVIQWDNGPNKIFRI